MGIPNLSDYSNGAGGPPRPDDTLSPTHALMRSIFGRLVPNPNPPTGDAQYGTGMSPATVAPVAISAAEDAAHEASFKASGSQGMNSRGPYPNYGIDGQPTTPGAKADPNAEWNTFVAKQLGAIGIPNAGAVLAQNKPGWDKASGVAAINAGGAPRRLNYGDRNEIIGSGSGSRGQFNSFTGVGGGPGAAYGDAGAGFRGNGAAGGGVGAGGGNSNTPFDAVTNHLADLMMQASALRKRGDLAGALQARGLEGHVSRMSGLFATLAQHAHGMGQIAAENRRIELGEQIAGPDIALQRERNRRLNGGDYQGAAALERASKGSPLTATKTEPYGSYEVNADLPWDDPSRMANRGYPTFTK